MPRDGLRLEDITGKYVSHAYDMTSLTPRLPTQAVHGVLG